MGIFAFWVGQINVFRIPPAFASVDVVVSTIGDVAGSAEVGIDFSVAEGVVIVNVVDFVVVGTINSVLAGVLVVNFVILSVGVVVV